MKHVMFSIVPVMILAAGTVAGQALPSAPPGDNPTNTNVYMGRLPKVDKSKLRDIKGVVKDESGNAIEGAIVQLKDVKTGRIQSYRTKADGAYLFYDLNIDLDYEVTAKSDDRGTPLTKKLLRYDTRKKPVLNFDLAAKKPA